MNNGKWTVDDIPDLSGKVIIVTGGNSGLGYESVKAFAAKNATVILTSRTVEKGEKARNEIVAELHSADIQVMQLDLADLRSIREFAGQFAKKYRRLDILLNNAGIMMTPYQQTKDGFESQVGTNHLGHFALTGLLLDLIRTTENSRVVNVSSNAHKWGKMDFDNLLFENGKDYSPTNAYGRSKLANLLFTYELQSRLKEHKINSMALAAHPGISLTNLARHLEDKWWYNLMMLFSGLITQKAEYGALPQIRAAVDPRAEGGSYYGPNGFNQMKGDPVVVESSKASHDKEDAMKLWAVSERLTGVNYKF